MKQRRYCDFCRRHANYERHLLFLAILHLEIEHFPRQEFSQEEVHDKVSGLAQHIDARNIHLNMAYATTQLVNTKQGISQGPVPTN